METSKGSLSVRTARTSSSSISLSRSPGNGNAPRIIFCVQGNGGKAMRTVACFALLFLFFFVCVCVWGQLAVTSTKFSTRSHTYICDPCPPRIPLSLNPVSNNTEQQRTKKRDQLVNK